MAWGRRLDFISIQFRLASKKPSQVMVIRSLPDALVREDVALGGVKWKKHI